MCCITREFMLKQMLLRYTKFANNERFKDILNSNTGNEQTYLTHNRISTYNYTGMLPVTTLCRFFSQRVK